MSLENGKPRSVGRAALVSLATVGGETLVCWMVFRDSLADIVMVFLLGVVVMAVRFGYAASLLATALSVAALDFFFTRPYFSFAVADRRLVLTIVIMGLYLREETDELERAIVGEAALWATGGLLAIATTWGFLEQYGLVMHIEAWAAFPLWAFCLGPANIIVRRRYQ